MMSFEEIPNNLRKEWENLAIRTAEYEFLDEMRKVILADIASEKTWVSEAEKNRLALSDERYKKHLEALRDSRHAMLKSKTEIEALNARFQWYMSTRSTERAEMNLR